MKNTSATSPTYLLRIVSLICVCAFLHLSLPAQDFDRYQRLRCEGTIPPALLGSVTAKYQKRVAELEKSKEADEQKAKEDFLLESSFFLDGLLRGGSVFFNDPVSEYLNNLKDFILRDNAELRDKIQVFTLKSTAVNAFATNEGVVLVTTGLLAHVRNEAALAMVMCHEFQHYLQRHAMKRHLVAKQNKKERVYRDDDEALALETCRYSRDQEMEADTLGLKLFLSTGYSSVALDDCFDLLLYAPYHYDLNAVWDKSFFESANLKFPATFHLDTIAAIQPDSTEDDTRHTHPNVAKRRAAAKAVLAAQGAVEGPLYILGEERFKSITTICRFEQSALMLQRQRYEATIFNTFLLLREYPESYFLRKTLVQALYGLARHRNENEYNGVHLPPDFVEGGHQPLHHFFDLIEKPALNILALRFASDLCRQYPTDKSLADIRADLLKDMHFFHPEKTMLLESQDAPAQYYDSLQGFGAVQPSVVMVKSEKDDEGNSEEVYENTYKPRQRNYADNYYRYGLAEFLRDSAHTPLVAKAKEKAKKLKADETAAENNSNRRMRARRFALNEFDNHLGIENLLVITPKVVIYNEYKDNKLDRLASEEGNANYRKTIGAIAKELRLKPQILDPADLKANEVTKFNEIMVMKDYIDAISGDSEVPLIHFDQTVADSLIKKYKTRHVAYMYLVKAKERFRYEAGHFIFGMMLWPVGIPYLAVRWVFPNYSVIVATAVFDLKENKTLMVEYRRIKGRPNQTRIQSAIYNTLFQIRTKSR